jgi:hypothetical protein
MFWCGQLTDNRAFGADDVTGALYDGKRLGKLRFLMTDNSLVGAHPTRVPL